MGLGGLLKGAAGIITGGLSGLPGKIIETVSGQFPEKMSEAEKAALEVKIQQIVHQQEVEMLDKWNEESESHRLFISQHEGTASDLAQLGWLGKILLGLRGIQRPVWGFATLILDFKVVGAFLGGGMTTMFAAQSAVILMYLLMAINLIVLTFLFGERTIKNIMPLIESAIKAWKGNN
jgi:hypothetical protein